MTLITTATMKQLLDIRLHESSLEDVLDRLVHISKEALRGADAVSTTLVRDDKPFTAAHTGQLAIEADEMQYERGYGPCIDAGESNTVLVIGDMQSETRWPDYAQRVVPRGVLSSLSVPLPLNTDVVGALNCYSSNTETFSDEHIDLAQELAAHVAVAVANAVHYTDTAKAAQNLRVVMASRVIIEQAKGVVMARLHCSEDEAFDALRNVSQQRNIKLRDVAKEVVHGAQERNSTRSTPPRNA